MRQPNFVLPVSEIDLSDPAGAVVQLIMGLAMTTPGWAAAVRMPGSQVSDITGPLLEMCNALLADGEPGEVFRVVVRHWPSGWADVALVYYEAETSRGEEARWDP